MDVYFYKYNFNGKYIVIIKIIFQKNDLYIYMRTELDELNYLLQLGGGGWFWILKSVNGFICIYIYEKYYWFYMMETNLQQII